MAYLYEAPLSRLHELQPCVRLYMQQSVAETLNITRYTFYFAQQIFLILSKYNQRIFQLSGNFCICFNGLM